MSYYGALLVLGVALQIMVLSAMLRGLWSRYPLVFSYVVVSFFATVTQESFSYYFGRASNAYREAYWIGDFAGTFLLLLVIIHLIRTAMVNHPRRSEVYWGLMLGMAATAVASILFVNGYSRGFRLGRLLTELGRNYYFSAVLLNAILWVTLMRVQHPDRMVYLFSSGLGLKLTGAAIAHALRLTTSGQTYWFAANQILIFSYLASLYVWYVAVKRFSTAVPAGGTAGESGPPVSFEYSVRDR
jgi:hypothetical protein